MPRGCSSIELVCQVRQLTSTHGRVQLASARTGLRGWLLGWASSTKPTGGGLLALLAVLRPAAVADVHEAGTASPPKRLCLVSVLEKRYGSLAEGVSCGWEH